MIPRLKNYASYFLFISVYLFFIFYWEAHKNYKKYMFHHSNYFFGSLDFNFFIFYFFIYFFLRGKYLLVDKHLEGFWRNQMGNYVIVKLSTSCRIKAAGQWNMVCQLTLFFGTYKFRDSVENEKFILFLNRNTGLTVV